MSDIIRRAAAGTLESSDVYVEIEPGDGALEIELDSVVMNQFGAQIRQVASEVLAEQGVTSAKLRLVDRGALECVIRARVETAVVRGKGE